MTPLSRVCARAQPLGGREVRTPQLSGGPPKLLTQRFCRGVHRQASRVNSVYNSNKYRRRKKEEILPVIIAGIRFLSRVSTLTRVC